MVILFILGLAVGLVSSLLGIGGGIFLIPFLPELTSWSPHQVVAITLVVIFGNALMNLWWFHKRGLVAWPVLKFWGPFAATGSFAGSYLALQFPGRSLKLAFLAIVLVAALKFIKDFFMKWEHKKLFVTSNWRSSKGVYGLFVGTLSGFCGVGTGLVSNLLFMSRRWVVKERVAPTGNGVMAFVSFSSALTFLFLGSGHQINFAFFKAHFMETLAIMVGVFVTSFVARPFNFMVSDRARFVSLMGLLLFVLAYTLKDLL